MPQKERMQPQKIEMPASMLNKSPEDLDEILSKLSGSAVAEGNRVYISIEQAGKTLEPDSPHKSDIKRLREEAQATVEKFHKDLKSAGVPITPEKKKATPKKKAKVLDLGAEPVEVEDEEKPDSSAWQTAEGQKIRKKLEQKLAKKKKEQAMGHVRANLNEEALFQNLGEIDPENISKDQQQLITEFTEKANTESEKAKLSNKEKMQILQQMPDYLNVKEALMNSITKKIKDMAGKHLEGINPKNINKDQEKAIDLFDKVLKTELIKLPEAERAQLLSNFSDILQLKKRAFNLKSTQLTENYENVEKNYKNGTLRAEVRGGKAVKTRLLSIKRKQSQLNQKIQENNGYIALAA